MALPASAETREPVNPVHVSASASDVSAAQPVRKMTRAEKKALAKAQAEAEAARAALKASVKRASMLKPVKGRIWCVPFAREASGIQLKGNAGTWWGKAAGLYNRSRLPQVGAVMNFASSRKMPMGHVAVVSNILDSRRIQIDHANWVRNKVTLDQTVIDVSEANDWSQVRVVNADGSLGRVNPVHGFISN
ncbi:MAG TPA: CHAP domain-containing protein [Gemmobacter sp.]|nr:CHAP domain-containing protein [Gemmobacter sp.]